MSENVQLDAQLPDIASAQVEDSMANGEYYLIIILSLCHVAV